jgi:RNA polymerase sigma-70 factor (ECF subfamily)
MAGVDVAKPPQAELEAAFEQLRPQLTGYCYRMLGSAFAADDAVQETMLRAWRSYGRFEGRAALSSWLYRIATNVCLTMLDGRKRRARPMDLGGPSAPEVADASTLVTHEEEMWVEPIPTGRVVSGEGDPAAVAESRETLRLAFVAALQHLPPRQRAVLILREVLRWQATEVAELLETSVASVNSALQRARATLGERDVDAGEVSGAEMGAEDRELLGRYVEAFEDFDMDALVTLLHEDATMSMPPFELWLRGADAIRAWNLGPGSGCRGSRLVPVDGNGMPGFGQYRAAGDGSFRAWGLQLMDISDGRIAAINCFLDVERMFPMFGLPLTLPADGRVH